MLVMARIIFVFLLLSIFVDVSVCQCKKSYMTICDTFEDFAQFKDFQNLKEVMIGSNDGTAKPTSVHLMNTLELRKYHKLSTLIIIRAINNLEMSYAFECTYYNSPLKYLTLYGNELKTIEEYHFPVLPLKKFSLVNNKIESIKVGAFTYHEVEEIDLSDNLMEIVESGALPLTNATKIITIRNNKLTHLEDGSFPSNLRSLNLDHNNLRYVLDAAFGNLVNLEELTLSHNKFNEMPKISHLTQLVLFDISFNSISTVQEGTFKNMRSLKFVDLSNNNIASDRILQWLLTPGKQQTLTISLVFNGLRTLNLSGVTLENQTLVLYGNPWDCKTWNQLKTQLIGHESECDVEFSSSGKVPFCFDFVLAEYFLNDNWKKDLKRFQDVVRNSTKLAKCNLNPDRYELLYPIRYGCVV